MSFERADVKYLVNHSQRKNKLTSFYRTSVKMVGVLFCVIGKFYFDQTWVWSKYEK